MLTMDKIEAPYLAALELGGGDIVVIGAYKGDTVAFLRDKHPDSSIYAYEPQGWAYNELSNRFVRDRMVRTYWFGIGVCTEDGVAMYEYGTDAASLLPLPNHRTIDRVELHDARVLAVPHDVNSYSGQMALCFMNIEGYEYQLIPYMLELGMRPDHWMIQFHFIEKSLDDHFAIHEMLKGAGYRLWSIGKGWERWSCV